MEKTEVVVKTTRKDPVLSGDNIVDIISAVKEILMNVLDNYRLIKISQNELEMRSLKTSKGKNQEA